MCKGVKQEYVTAIVKYYNDEIEHIRAGLIWRFLTYGKITLFSLNDNSDRCIVSIGKGISDLFKVFDDRIHAGFWYVCKLDKEIICGTSDGEIYYNGGNIYSKIDKFSAKIDKFSAKIDKLVREENHSIIYTDMAIFLIDNDEILFC